MVELRDRIFDDLLRVVLNLFAALKVRAEP